ncbi:MipA/OmpV family protein [Thalassotalea sp. LPB0316]|uniref:MipA/OmpV family protein n=1 Tax=Thalassotalea sp. LPB0316 TaxID=2769490 RepID=UPI001867CC8C|nr:MipA/OmpV family protein [Thalassotalea sp. LPB0316]QOL26126.1 MipA/OmpV family protein [Thalassotalea sp. LPB0316]
MLALIFPKLALSEENCPSCEFNWQIGLAVGQTYYESPLSGADDISLPVIPLLEMSYGRFYLKNTTLTYDLYQTETRAFSLKGKHNFDGLYHYANDKGIDGKFAFIMGNFGEPEVEEEPEEKRLSYLAGVEFTQLSTEYNSLFTYSLLNDVTNTHNGFEAEFKWTKIWLSEKFELSTDAVLTYKSDDLFEYYYDSELTGSNVVKKFSVNLAYPLLDNWWLALNYQYQALPGKMTNSPIVDESSLHSYFAGIIVRW